MLPLDVAVHHQDHRLVVSHIPDQHRQFGDAQCLAGGLAAVSADDLVAAIPTGAYQQRREYTVLPDAFLQLFHLLAAGHPEGMPLKGFQQIG